MNANRFIAILLIYILFGGTGQGADIALWEEQKAPVLRIDGRGPTSLVTALAFSPDGKKLYAAGNDKVVRVWRLKDNGEFDDRNQPTYRVMIGGGIPGAINTIALSPDGKWLAAGGRGVMRGERDYRHSGHVVPHIGAVDKEMRQDQGMIYVYRTDTPGNQLPEVHLLRGHRGPVLATAFAPSKNGNPYLVSAGVEWDDEGNKYMGVVRVWDIKAKDNKCLATLDQGLPNELKHLTQKPGLAVWPIGKGPKQLRVAIAWEDGWLRLWDVEQGKAGLIKRQEALPGGQAFGKNNTAAVLAGGAKPILFTASSRARAPRLKVNFGHLQEWTLAAGAGRPRPGREIDFDPQPNKADRSWSYFYPRALALLSSQGNGSIDHAALVHLVNAGEYKNYYQLDVVSLSPRAKDFGKQVATRFLWKFGHNPPVLAAAPGGRYLAVAGNNDHVIRVYPIADLLKNQFVEQQEVDYQPLRSVGATITRVAFAKNGKSRGLWLWQQTGTGKPSRKVIFDFSRGTLSADLSDWKTEFRSRGWEVKVWPYEGKEGQEYHQVHVFHRDDLKWRFKFSTGEVVTSSAILPPMEPLGRPIVALALLDLVTGQPVLRLYDVQTGNLFRQLSGHVDPIRSLAFSGDGKLLASAAEDQTVCLWSLSNVQEILGQKGLIPGLAVGEGKGGVEVKAVGEASPAFNNVRSGAIIQGVVVRRDGKEMEVKIKSPRHFYETIWQQQPGDKIGLRLAGQKQEVEVKVGQGVDDQGALFSLFITQARKPEDQRWIGWNPAGPYDSTSRQIMRQLVLHVNKGDEADPASAILASEFEKDFYYPGLLKHLVHETKLAPALRAWKKAKDEAAGQSRPILLASLEETGAGLIEPDDSDQYPVRTRKVSLRVKVIGFDLKDGGSLEWKFGDGKWQAFKDNAGNNEWIAELDEAAWRRGKNRIQAILRTPGEGPRDYREELVAAYQPPPPRIEFPAKLFMAQKELEYLLQALVIPGEPREEVEVSLFHKGAGKESERVWQKVINKRFKLEYRFKKLSPGRNEITLVARNKNALKGAEDRETETLPIVIDCPPKKQLPPEITLEIVHAGKSDQVMPGKRFVVNVPQVRIVGRVKAREGYLARVRWDNGTGKLLNLKTFGPNEKQKKFDIDETVPLEPGVNPTTYRFLAKSTDSNETPVDVAIAFHPLLPSLTLAAPPHGQVYYAGEDKRRVEVVGKLKWPAGYRRHYKCTAEISVQGRRVARIPLDNPLDEITKTVDLALGQATQIEVSLKSDWQPPVTKKAVVRYLRPPQILTLRPAPPLVLKRDKQQRLVYDQPFIDLVAEVKSPVKLDKVRAEVGSAGRQTEMDDTNLKIVPPPPNQPGANWQVILEKVALVEGENEVILEVRNSEAWSRKTSRLTLQVDFPKPPKPPKVELGQPAKDIIVSAPEPAYTVRGQVTSEEKPTRIVVIQKGQKDRSYAVDLQNAKSNALGVYDVAINVDVALAPGKNELYILARNAGGEKQSVTRVVIYVPQRPVRLEFQKLIPPGPGAKPSLIRRGQDGELRFNKVPTGWVTLVGRVSWDKGNDRLFGSKDEIALKVNGICQLPARLEPPKKGLREREFRTTIVLTRKGRNLIEAELPPKLKASADNRPAVVDCEKPITRQHLYVLPISTSEKEKGETPLLRRVARVLQTDATRLKEGRFDSPLFAESRLFGPLTYPVSRVGVFSKLYEIKTKMRDRKERDAAARKEPSVDVLMIYFHGGFRVKGKELVFRTSFGEDLTSTQLSNQFRAALGAQLVFMNVVLTKVPGEAGGENLAKGEDLKKKALWPADSQTIVFGFAWLDPEKPKNKETISAGALQKAIGEGGRLKEVEGELKSLSRELMRTYPLSLLCFCPDQMAEFSLGNKKKKG
jgi:WD40 repeat protein